MRPSFKPRNHDELLICIFDSMKQTHIENATYSFPKRTDYIEVNAEVTHELDRRWRSAVAAEALEKCEDRSINAAYDKSSTTTLLRVGGIQLQTIRRHSPGKTRECNRRSSADGARTETQYSSRSDIGACKNTRDEPTTVDRRIRNGAAQT